MSVLPPVLLGTARAVSAGEFYDALQAIAPPRFPFARGTQHRRVALAISGGVDSMALAFLCSQLKKRDPFMKVSDNNLGHWVPMIVNHRLRDGSETEAEDVKRVLNEKMKFKRVEVLTVKWEDHLGPGASSPRDHPNLESLARRARYYKLGRACAHYNIASMLLAHHQDDQYETVLMRMLAGHGYRGLTGMRSANDIPECYDLHKAYQSGFIDDQFGNNPYYNFAPDQRERREMRRFLRDQIDPAEFAVEMARGMDAYSEAALLEADMKSYKPSKRAPPLTPMLVEDGGVKIYRPLLDFGKDRLMVTCLQNGIPWFEDHTNHDPTLTTRNALRHLHKNHSLPVALQKPAILRLSEKCRRRVVAEDAEAERLLSRMVLNHFEPGVGTALVELPSLCLPKAPRKFLTSQARQKKRLAHYRVIAALLIRKLLNLVTPEQHIPTPNNLDGVVSRLFPSLTHQSDLVSRSPPKEPKSFSISGVLFVPIVGDHPLRWYLSRAPHSSTLPRPVVRLDRLTIWMRWRKSPRQWKLPPYFSRWTMFDGRYWVRIVHKFPSFVQVAPFAPEYAKEFRESLSEDQTALLEAMLKKYTPGKVRFTLPAIYSELDVRPLLNGDDYWPPELKNRDGKEASGTSTASAENLTDDNSNLNHNADHQSGPGRIAESTNRDGHEASEFSSAASPAHLDLQDMTDAQPEPAQTPGASDGGQRREFPAGFIPHLKWEQAQYEKKSPQLLALPTLGIHRPSLEHWLQWEMRYRKVNFDVLRLSVPHAWFLRSQRRRRCFQEMRHRTGRPTVKGARLGWKKMGNRLPRTEQKINKFPNRELI